MAGEGVALVRLSGRWYASPERLVPDVRLVMVIGGVPVAIARVPDPAQPQAVAAPTGSPWRAAFRVSAEVIGQRGIDFRLEAGELALELDHPTELGRALPATEPRAAGEQVSEPVPEVEREPDFEPEPAPEPEPTGRSGTDRSPSSENHDALGQIRALEARLLEQEELVERTEQRATRAEVEFLQARAELEQAWGQAAELRNMAESSEERARRSEGELHENEARVVAAEREAAARARPTDDESAAEALRREAETRRRLELQAELDALTATEQQLRAELHDARERLAGAGPERSVADTARDDERQALDAERQAIEAELLRITQADAEREALEGEVEAVRRERDEIRRERDEAMRLLAGAEAAGYREGARAGDLDGRLREDALRRQIEDGGSGGGDRMRLLEEEIERRVTAEHELRAQLETQEAELGAARAAADSRARELQDAERRIAQAAIKSRAASAAAAPGEAPQFDDEVIGRIEAAKAAAALVGK